MNTLTKKMNSQIVNSILLLKRTFSVHNKTVIFDPVVRIDSWMCCTCYWNNVNYQVSSKPKLYIQLSCTVNANLAHALFIAHPLFSADLPSFLSSYFLSVTSCNTSSCPQPKSTDCRHLSRA